jgi:thiol-disulfide isomerase/thioredoxin
MRRLGVRQAVLVFVFCCPSTALFARSAESLPGAVHALLINGGDQPTSNYLSHFHHLEDMFHLLRVRGVASAHIDIFSADGEDPAADLTTRDSPPADFWLLDGTSLGHRLRPGARLTNTHWAGVTLHPARQAALREWFEAARKRIVPGDQLLIFVTDHGTGDRDDPDSSAISLWREKLTVREFKALLARLPAGVQVVMVMSQCYSGAFANVVSDGGPSDPPGDVCGFFSTTGQQRAYGCYPEGRDRDKIGHAFHFIEALGRRTTTSEAHADVLADDDTPDVPLRTSDAYLSRLVSAEAAARRMPADALVDSLLAQAWRKRTDWEPEIRLLDRIGTAFGTFSPRRLEEISSRENELEALTEQMSTYADRWKVAQAELEESLLQSFIGEQPDWRSRLDPRALEALSAEDRAVLVEQLLPPLLAHAHSRPESWQRLDHFRDHAVRGSEAVWRLEVRKAALQRMRTILVAIAGRVLLAQGQGRESSTETASRTAQRRALARLDRCEAFAVGEPPDPAPVARSYAAPPFPPLSEELALVEEISPSWLGVRFRPVAPPVRAARRLPAGANLLAAVYPDSPAQEAGLEEGDIVLGPPGQPFDSPRDLREWTMTAARGVALSLLVVRPGARREDDLQFEASLVLRAYPARLPRPSGPPLVGDRAPALPATLKPLRSSEGADVEGRPRVLFFWATWCGPCKKAVPEVMALAQSRGLSVLAITDEDEDTVSRFLEGRGQAFFDQVALDPFRQAFASYGISGTPTILLLDRQGIIRHRQVGYSPDKGVTIEGWSWIGQTIRERNGP